ncbi:hypothetical protein [Paraburkholderia silvatlantica]|uniref:hypothetical protein n=1 Tax=Paraburkholderia silvatlantica TaxID=321895 RepID=UPI0011B7D5CB|nr:hypothetical protein [Paraburkholderia silvatlantica]
MIEDCGRPVAGVSLFATGMPSSGMRHAINRQSMPRAANDPGDDFSRSADEARVDDVGRNPRGAAFAPALGNTHATEVHACIISDHSMRSPAINCFIFRCSFSLE